MKIKLEEALQFDDVLLEPQFSNIKSRKDVNTSSDLGRFNLGLPIISSPMDTITTPALVKTLNEAGAIGALHRFQAIGDNLKQFMACDGSPIVSVGINDWERVEALRDAGANKFLLDVAHGAQESVVLFVNEFRNRYKYDWLMVGNFATGNQITDFKLKLNNPNSVDVYRVGVGGGAACTTRIKTGHGLPTLESIISCARAGVPIVADGGIRSPGDFAKALAAGASAIMAGRIFAGTEETGSNIYRGSASADSYKIQNKEWACAEGEAYEVPCRGSASEVLKEFEAGLRSAMTYTGAETLTEFKEKAVFVKVSSNGVTESRAHGKVL